jgi:ADP-L-glycero-D-manno-heptose 6-epimerase
MKEQDRPILVTGAAGFVGARFVESCAERGLPVVSVDRPELFRSRPEHAGIRFGEIVGRDGLGAWLAERGAGLRAIVHLGACTDTTETDRTPLQRLNVDASKLLWRFATAARLSFVYASSAATYGAGSQGWDDDPDLIPKLEPLNPYGASKQEFDLWVLAEEREGRHPPAWSGFKFFNVYGFGERHKGRMASVVLQAFDQIRAGGSVRLFRSHRAGIADGHQKRDFVLVDDVVAVLHFALEKPVRRGIFNLGTGRARSFLDLARAVFAALDLPERIEFVDTPADIRERYQYFTEARMERLRAEGWERPFTPLEEGVRRTVERLLRAG